VWVRFHRVEVGGSPHGKWVQGPADRSLAIGTGTIVAMRRSFQTLRR